MPVLLVLLLLLVNFLPLAAADTVPTQIRGPKNADSVLLQKQFGPLTASDTLWRIAEQVKPNNSVTTYQVMYALFIKNPQAFNDANFNHLQPGAILLLPDLREIRSVDPEVARRKADMDDQLWAERVAREASARAKAREQAAKPNIAQQQTAAELNVLKDQYQDSMQLIEGIARENEQLRGSLSRVEQELQGLKAQLAEDSLLQQQLNQLLQQQQQILAEQQAQKAAEEAARLAAEQKSSVQDLLNNPLSWVLAASVPAILLLLGGLFWIKRRSRKTEETVAAAIKEPTATTGYQSPLPPLDTSQDFDDSLFDIDDGLLDDAFEPKESSKQTSSADTLLDDDLPDFSDDILLDELDETDPLRTDMLDSSNDESLDIAFDEPLANDDANSELSLQADDALNFDANNILSDTDLSALLAVEDDADEIIELADPEDAELTDLLGNTNEASPAPTFNSQDDIDSLLEEIELDLPESGSSVSLDEQFTGDTGQRLDDVAAENFDLLEDDELTQLQDPDAVDELLLDNERERGLASESRFDNSELEEFAEQLAAEAEDPDDIAILSDDEQQLTAELDDILQQAAAEQVQSPGAADSVLTAALDERLPDIEMHNLDQAEDNVLSLDLSSAEDNSVSRPSEAALSVENPSQVLDSYPELDLLESEQDDEDNFNRLAEQIEQLTTDPDDELDIEAELKPETESKAELVSEIEAEVATEFEPEIEAEVAVELEPEIEPELDATAAEDATLTDLEDSQFDALLTELAAIKQEESVAEDELDSPATESAESEDNPALSDEDFVEIDNLLNAMEQAEVDPERFNQLNVDVGLDDFADIIGEHIKTDVDKEDAGFAGKLDLIKAYIEMDEPESATLLIDELLTSEAPEHVKDEAKALRPE